MQPHSHAPMHLPTHNSTPACLCHYWVMCESCLLHIWQIKGFQHTLDFFFSHAPTSGRINGVQLFSNVIHFTGFGFWPDPPSVSSSPSPRLSLSLSFAWICPTFRNVTCLPSLSYARGTLPVSPPFRSGVLRLQWHLGYSTSLAWEDKGKQKAKGLMQ